MAKRNISIPYGAIKRKQDILSIQYVLKFQFLMVRLKDVFTEKELKYPMNFNSLWCD